MWMSKRYIKLSISKIEFTISPENQLLHSLSCFSNTQCFLSVAQAKILGAIFGFSLSLNIPRLTIWRRASLTIYRGISYILVNEYRIQWFISP